MILLRLGVALFYLGPNEGGEAAIPFLCRPANEFKARLDARYLVVKFPLDGRCVWLFRPVCEVNGILAQLSRDMNGESGRGIAKEDSVTCEWDLKGKEGRRNIKGTRTREDAVLRHAGNLHLYFLPWHLGYPRFVQNGDVQCVASDEVINNLIDVAIQEAVGLKGRQFFPELFLPVGLQVMDRSLMRKDVLAVRCGNDSTLGASPGHRSY